MWNTDHLDHVKYVFTWQSQPKAENPGWIYPPGTEGVELLIKGRSRLDIAGRIHQLGPGTMIWHQAGEQTIRETDAQDPYQVVSIKFATTRPPDVRPPRLTQWLDPEECQSFAAEAMAVYHGGGFPDREFGRYLYTRMWWQVHRIRIRHSMESDPAELRPALDIIEHQFARRISIAELARAAGLSPTHLHRLFRERLGTTPLAALVRRRLAHACVLLAHEDLAIGRVGIAAGFPDAVHFIRVFKSHHGCTPLAYRRRHTYSTIVH
jgi:AraC-like DNA-binding protein